MIRAARSEFPNELSCTVLFIHAVAISTAWYSQHPLPFFLILTFQQHWPTFLLYFCNLVLFSQHLPDSRTFSESKVLLFLVYKFRIKCTINCLVINIILFMSIKTVKSTSILYVAITCVFLPPTSTDDENRIFKIQFCLPFQVCFYLIPVFSRLFPLHSLGRTFRNFFLATFGWMN